MTKPILILIGLTLLIGCADTDTDTDETPDTTTTSDTPTAHDIVDDDTALQDPMVWLNDRYGPEHGTITVAMESDGETVRQQRFFTDHGEREAIKTYYETPMGMDTVVIVSAPDSIRIKNPNAPGGVTTQGWGTNYATRLPNFRHITDGMRKLYKLEELPSKTFIGKESKGYRLNIQGAVTELWVWEGIMMYASITAEMADDGKPMVFKTVAIDTTRPDAAHFEIRRTDS